MRNCFGIGGCRLVVRRKGNKRLAFGIAFVGSLIFGQALAVAQTLYNFSFTGSGSQSIKGQFTVLGNEIKVGGFFSATVSGFGSQENGTSSTLLQTGLVFNSDNYFNPSAPYFHNLSSQGTSGFSFSFSNDVVWYIYYDTSNTPSYYAMNSLADPYSGSFTATVAPEINSNALSKAVLLLACLYLISNRRNRRAPSDDAETAA